MDEIRYAGIPASEVIAFTEAINYLDLVESRMFGDAVNASIVRNVKAASLKGQAVSIRGLARVIGMQPSTIRRRIANLVAQDWLIHDDKGRPHIANPIKFQNEPAKFDLEPPALDQHHRNTKSGGGRRHTRRVAVGHLAATQNDVAILIA